MGCGAPGTLTAGGLGGVVGSTRVGCCWEGVCWGLEELRWGFSGSVRCLRGWRLPGGNIDHLFSYVRQCIVYSVHI